MGGPIGLGPPIGGLIIGGGIPIVGGIPMTGGIPLVIGAPLNGALGAIGQPLGATGGPPDLLKFLSGFKFPSNYKNGLFSLNSFSLILISVSFLTQSTFGSK